MKILTITQMCRVAEECAKIGLPPRMLMEKPKLKSSGKPWALLTLAFPSQAYSTLLGQWAKYYNDERLHSALKYLCLVDYYKGNPEALLAEQERKMRKAVAERKEVSRLIDLTKTKVGLSEND